MRKSQISNLAKLGANLRLMIIARCILRRLQRNTRGVAALEFAIIAPAFLALIGFGINVGQLQSQALSAQYFAGAGAMAAKTAGSSDPAVIEPAVTSLLNANAAFLSPGTTMQVGFAYPSGATTVTVTLTSPALWPIFVPTISATGNATQ